MVRLRRMLGPRRPEQVQAAESNHAAAAILASSPAASSSIAMKPGTVLGSLSITEVGLVVPILEAADPATLSRGVGHVPGTALPGGLGNLVLAGHRDSYFRPLRNVRSGMQIEVATQAGKWQYAIDSTEIVTPDQVSILDIGERPEMTLITCYHHSTSSDQPRSASSCTRTCSPPIRPDPQSELVCPANKSVRQLVRNLGRLILRHTPLHHHLCQERAVHPPRNVVPRGN